MLVRVMNAAMHGKMMGMRVVSAARWFVSDAGRRKMREMVDEIFVLVAVVLLEDRDCNANVCTKIAIVPSRRC